VRRRGRRRSHQATESSNDRSALSPDGEALYTLTVRDGDDETLAEHAGLTLERARQSS
jgi:hypothetical protein